MLHLEEAYLVAKTNLFRSADNAEAFSAGQTIFEEGQLGEAMFIAELGEIEIIVGPNVLETLTPGDMFGEMTLIERRERSAMARARTDCRVVPVDVQQFTFLMQQKPHGTRRGRQMPPALWPVPPA